MSELNIAVKQFRGLVTPVLPMASSDPMIPILNSVLIESRGKWLTATATDRFRLAIKRVKAPEDDWPEFRAIVPASTIKAILAAFKPSRRDSNPELTLTITAQDRMKVVGGSALLDMLGADIDYPLTVGTFPDVQRLVRDALNHKASTTSTIGLNFGFLADFAKAESNLAIRITTPASPAVITNGDDFLGIIMPRRLVEAVGSDGDLLLDADWTSLLAPQSDEAKESAA